MSRFEIFDRSRLLIKPFAERQHDLHLDRWLALTEATPPFEHADLPTVAARIAAAKALTEGIQSAIHEIARNPLPGAAGHTQEQNLKTLVSQLNDLLTKMSGPPSV